MNEQGFSTPQRWVLGLTAAASFIAVMDGMVVTTALDSIRRDLTAPLSYLHWTMTAYSLSFASLLMAGAALGDRFGRRSMFVFGLLVFALASAGCAAATSIGWLVFARALQGAASAILVPDSYSSAISADAETPRLSSTDQTLCISINCPISARSVSKKHVEVVDRRMVCELRKIFD